MKIEHFTFKMDCEGNEYITYAEGITKTRQSGLKEKHRLVIPKMFENSVDKDKCPVNLYKFYLQKRPLELRDKGPFYLAIIINPATDVWFKASPMGKNKIDNIMKTMKLNSSLKDIDKKLTNHSARKTVVKKLKQAKVPRSEIIGITGHRHEKSLDSYDSGDELEQRNMSLAIDNPRQSLTNNLVQQNRSTPPNFNFFPDNFWDSVNSITPTPSTISQPVYNFNNCTFNFSNSSGSLHLLSTNLEKELYLQATKIKRFPCQSFQNILCHL